MKKLLKTIYNCLILIAFALMLNNGTTAQICSSSTPDTDPGNHYNLESGNDVWYDGCINFRVWVSDGDLSWDYSDCYGNASVTSPHLNYSNPGSPSLVSRPDVAIATGVTSGVTGDDLWVLLVYWDPSTSHYYFHKYQGNISTLTSVFTLQDMGYVAISGTVSTSHLSGPCIRIDANSNGDFAIVYSTNATLRTMAGNMQGLGNTPTLGHDLDLANAAEMDQCDVAIAEYATQGTANVFYTYSVYGGSVIYVSHDQFYNLYSLATSVNAITDTRTITTNYLFKTPRIACPNYATNLDTYNWAVCWESEKIGANSYMLGLMCQNNNRFPNSTTTGYHNYSDGSEPYFTGAAFNSKIYPAISYDNYSLNGGFNYIKMAWYGYPSGGSRASIIGISTDDQGYVISPGTCVPSGYCYEYAAYYIDSKQILPSLAGRHGLKMNLAFVDGGLNQISEKDFDYCVGFKGQTYYTPNSDINHHLAASALHEKNDAKLPSLQISPNPSTAGVTFFFSTDKPNNTYQLTITDMMGRQLHSIQGDAFVINNRAGNEIKKLNTGVYLIAVLQQGHIVASSMISRL